MKAYVFYQEKTLKLEDMPTPKLDDNTGAIIKVIASSICGTDIRTYRFGSSKIDNGRIIGHEVVGEIVELSKQNKEFKVGDHVAMAPAIGCGSCICCKKGKTNMCSHLETIGFQYDGGFAEYMAVPQKAFDCGNVYVLPKSDDYTRYALAEPMACALNAQSYLNIEKGESVLIFGSGIIGCLHAELAFASGAEKVFLAEPSKARLNQAKELLPNVRFVNSSEENLDDVIASETNGNGVNVAIIACSVGAAQEQGLRLLAKCGRISLFGGLAGESKGFLDSNVIHYKEAGVFGVHASSVEQNKKSMALIRDGVIDVEKYISARYPLAEIDTAFLDVAAGKIIKAIITN